MSEKHFNQHSIGVQPKARSGSVAEADLDRANHAVFAEKNRTSFPPLWKIHREVRRISDKVALFFGRHVHDRLRKPVYDITARARQRATNGKFQLTDRVVVFVIFQPRSIPASILLTLDHLQANGFSAFVVSNGYLRPVDRATLATNAALVMERPNVGYDFGAYRDGIRYLWSINHGMSRLILMNDSTWFPLRRDDDSLARMEALDADLAGHVFKTENETMPENDHVESHLLMFSRRFLQSGDFRRFWSAYRMSDRRSTTIKFGEKGLSQMTLRQGWRIETLMGREWLNSVLRCLDDQSLEAVFSHTIDGFSRKRESDLSIVRHLHADGKPWREAYLAWTDKSLRNSMSFLLSAAFVMPALIYGRMGFAKKANDIRFHMARQELLDLEASGLIPSLDDAVRSEVEQSVRSWAPPKGQETLPRQRSSLKIEVMG